MSKRNIILTTIPIIMKNKKHLMKECVISFYNVSLLLEKVAKISNMVIYLPNESINMIDSYGTV